MVIGLVLAGKDMGTAIVLALLTAAAYWVAGAATVLCDGGVVLAGATTLLVFAANSRTGRIAVWLADSCDQTAACYQQTTGRGRSRRAGCGASGLG